MNREDKKEFVEAFEPYFKKFDVDSEGNLIYLQINNKKVNNLAILVELEVPNSMIFKYGEKEDLLEPLNIHSAIPDTNFAIIDIPLDMYKWIEFCFEHSASPWVDYLIDELELQNNNANS